MDKNTQKIKTGFENSQPPGFQIRNILYVCDPYHLPGLKADIYPFPWEITYAVSMKEAATLLRKAAFALVFIEMGALDDGTGTTVQHLKTLCPGLQVIFLVPPGHFKTRLWEQNADHMFIWSGKPELFHAMVRFIEDQICSDTTRRAVLLVEDSLEYTSFFLPEIYKGIDAAFPGGRPPRLVLAGSHEAAMARFRELGKHLDCVLSDTRLPWQGKEAPRAGIDILSTIHREMPGLPIMLMSAEKANKIMAQGIPAPFLDKNADQPARDFHTFFRSLAPDRPARGRKTCPKDRYPVQTSSAGFTRIGNGSIGGKARGLAFLAQTLNRRPDLGTAYPEMAVSIPDTLVLCTDIFDDFVRENDLDKLTGRPLTELVQAFIDAPLPREALRHLKTYLAATFAPLAVRSSSLLEDAAAHPCAGLYKTYMIPNNHADPDLRLSHLATAVKLVYASAYYKKARAFVRSTTAPPFKDSMAVMIQEVAGSRHKDFFYPAISGTAHSLNFYPGANAKTDEGVLNLALGLGHTLAQGEQSFRVFPKHPQATPQFSGTRDFLEKTQNRFYALRMADYPDSLCFGICSNLARRDLSQALNEPPVKALAATYMPAEDRIRDTWYCKGPKIITFAQVLKYGAPPLTALVNDLMTALADDAGGPIELEFAADLPDKSGQPWKISLLQVRSMSSPRDSSLITKEDLDEAVCVSTSALGNCTLDTIRDIVYVNPDTFEGCKTRDMAQQISRINAELTKTNRRFLLAGPGRWGSSDPWLGIPVDWQQISGAGAIVEIRDGTIHADASGGSHFFNTITAQGVPYITVNPEACDRIDLENLAGCHAVRDEGFIRHMRLKHPLLIKVDGKHSRSVIMNASKPR
ncbi:PEP/pyruvate-binding domain-containing protein [Desulfobacter curvatus]|uniref:PEP/pyruvate-binding domain-containing protein n=1 Tax=Desulfobacter curvatus TaxID=2290 RepID=UPI0003700F14|nr:PEP/pyruvate-binding domain-containing protein [Desulfobacter curvatus]